jgi:type II secretory pathway predicted ATPase ExeA
MKRGSGKTSPFDLRSEESECPSLGTPTCSDAGEEMHNNNFLNYFGLREAPFSVNLDPRFLFVTPQLEKAFSEVMDGIHNRNCFAVITGEVGTGKTTLMHRLRRRLMQQGSPTAFLFYTHLNRTQLLDFILTDFGIPCKTGETIDGWKRLENWLVERHCRGQTPVLLVDEAQGLPLSTFEEIRMLLNLETSREKLLQVVLAGELELEEKLKRIRMRDLQQRITAHCKTAMLNRDETFDYVQNRLQVSGAKSQPLLQPDTMDAIYFHSRGIPRVINVLCEQALINACANQVHVVTPHLIQGVALAFQWEYPRHLPPTGSPASLAKVDSAPDPRIAAPELPLAASQDALNNQPAVFPVSPSAKATETGSEILLKNRSRSPIPDSPTTPIQQCRENIALGTLSARGGEKWQSAELSNSSSGNLLAEFIQELDTKINFSHASVQAKIRGREACQSAHLPLAMKVKNQRAGLQSRAASPFWAWWFHGSRPGWWKNIAAVMNLPLWRHRCASLQRWLWEPLRTFQRELRKWRSGSTKRSLTEKSM